MRDNFFEVIESTQKIEFTTDVPKNALVLKNKKITAKAGSNDFRYKAEPLIVAKGRAEVDMNTVDIEVGIAFTTYTQNGRVIPHVTAVDVKCDINRFDINIKLWGNLVTDLGSLFEVFFVGTVAGLIEDTLTLTLEQGIPKITNKVLNQMNGYLPIPFVPNWVIDW